MPPIASNIIIQDFFQAKLKTIAKSPQQAQIEAWGLSILTNLYCNQFQRQHLSYYRLTATKNNSFTMPWPAPVILGHTLASVWRHHWAMVFDYQPFSSVTILRDVQRRVQVSIQEALLISRVSLLPLPHIVL
ncbi:hypothetical protein CU097_012722 [Rhizopus azygosporus]|uniref:Uncharacterized protein n=1 Tax=Rhizopus azygosporus TaxID=86630 RepID=A0A367KAC9_RHIAZ|nr:hypothetical protein CU097_012722 [Rhizopus azygosporus]